MKKITQNFNKGDNMEDLILITFGIIVVIAMVIGFIIMLTNKKNDSKL